MRVAVALAATDSLNLVAFSSICEYLDPVEESESHKEQEKVRKRTTFMSKVSESHKKTRESEKANDVHEQRK
jgi:hypothetical protein